MWGSHSGADKDQVFVDVVPCQLAVTYQHFRRSGLCTISQDSDIIQLIWNIVEFVGGMLKYVVENESFFI